MSGKKSKHSPIIHRPQVVYIWKSFKSESKSELNQQLVNWTPKKKNICIDTQPIDSSSKNLLSTWLGSSVYSQDVSGRNTLMSEVWYLTHSAGCEHGALISQTIDLFWSSACLRQFLGDWLLFARLLRPRADIPQLESIPLPVQSFRSHPYAITHAGKAKFDSVHIF